MFRYIKSFAVETKQFIFNFTLKKAFFLHFHLQFLFNNLYVQDDVTVSSYGIPSSSVRISDI